MADEDVARVLSQVAGMLARSRHADAVRVLRAAAGAAARRGRHEEEGTLWLAMGRIVRHRGRTGEAEDALRRAVGVCERGAPGAGLADCAIEMAWLCVDGDRLVESAEWLDRAGTWAAAGGDEAQRAMVGWLRAYVAIWDGRVRDVTAWVAASQRDSAPTAPPFRVGERPAFGAPRGLPRPSRLLLAPPGATSIERLVRARMAEGHAGEAWVRHSIPPRETRWQATPANLDAVANCEADLVLALARGDEAAARRLLAEGVTAAGEASAPLQALALGLTAAERWPASWAEPGLRILARWRPAVLPGLFRRRVASLTALEASRRDAPGPETPPRDAGVDGADSEAVEILDVINHAPDEQAALDRACAWLCGRVGAAGVAIWTCAAGLRHVAGAGDAPSSAMGGRVATEAHRFAERGQAITGEGTTVVPMRYDGRLAGVLAVWWREPGAERRSDPVASVVASAAALSVRAVGDRLGARPVVAGPSPIVGCSAVIEALRRQVAQAAATPFPVLIEGESGTGKELAARAIHAASDRRARRFCAVNCAALTDDLLEAELFGHVRGAFTGAVTDRPGLFEDADGGTLFLDEVAELSARAQAKLLRVLQEGEIRRVGETHTRTVDVRVIAATNRPLAAEVTAGRFREDLRYRLDVVRLETPPLRARREDIPMLAESFWRVTQQRTGTRAVLSADLCDELARRPWPGNVRQLQNTLAALAARAPRAGRLSRADLDGPDGQGPGPAGGERRRLQTARLDFERAFVRDTLLRFGGRRARAAAELGVTRQGLAKLVARLGLEDHAGAGGEERGPFRRP